MASLVCSCDGTDLFLMSCKNPILALYALVLPIFNRLCLVNYVNELPISKSFSSSALLVATNSCPKICMAGLVPLVKKLGGKPQKNDGRSNC